MPETSPIELVRRRYQALHGAQIQSICGTTLHLAQDGHARAALGYRRAASGPLFLERYLDAPVEVCLSGRLGWQFARESIIEIGNLACDDAMAMVSLWGSAANDLGAECEVAVATLTAPLRGMFRRIGIPLHVIGHASIALSGDPDRWGRYYDSDPLVCAGKIADGQRAIAAFLARRRWRAVA